MFRACITSVFFASSVFASPVLAEECPRGPDISAPLTALIEQASAAKDVREGQRLSDKMWELWTQAPDAYAQELLDEGMGRRGVYDFDGAYKAFDALVAYCPNYAEGYNQRAFISYLRQDFAAAEVDLLKTLSLSPDHVAAQSGLALTYIGLNRMAEAYDALKIALAKNPWIPERGLLSSLKGSSI